MPRKKRAKASDEKSVWELSPTELIDETDRLDDQIASLNDDLARAKARKSEIAKRTKIMRELDATRSQVDAAMSAVDTYQTLIDLLHETPLPLDASASGRSIQTWWDTISVEFGEETRAVDAIDLSLVRPER